MYAFTGRGYGKTAAQEAAKREMQDWQRRLSKMIYPTTYKL